MIFCRIAYDAAGKDEERKQFFEAHRAHLRSGMVNIVQSGPVFGTGDGNPKIGALIVFDANEAADVETFSARDPYVINNVYDRIEIVRWDKTIG